MNRIFYVTLLLLGFLFVSNSSYADDKIYYCADELGTGFKKNSGKYEEVSFEKKRFTISFSDDWLELETGDEKFSCRDIGVLGENEGFARICTNTGRKEPQSFVFEMVSMRYVRTSVSPWGYIFEAERDTDNMSAGKCEKF